MTAGRTRELWARYLAGGALNGPEEAELLDGLRQGLIPRDEILDDVELHSLLRQADRIRRTPEGFEEAFFRCLRAKETESDFIRKLDARVEGAGSGRPPTRRAFRARRSAALRPSDGRSRVWWLAAVATLLFALGVGLASRPAPAPRRPSPVAGPLRTAPRVPAPEASSLASVPRPEEAPRVESRDPAPRSAPPQPLPAPERSPGPPEPLPAPPSVSEPLPPPAVPKGPAPEDRPRPEPATETRPAVASLTDVAGTVLHAGRPISAAVTPVEPGTAVAVGDAGSAATLLLPDGTTLRLGSSTRVAGIVPDPGLRVQIDQGRVEASVKRQPAGRPLVLMTPHARATVLGTRFVLHVTPGQTRLDVSEGVVQLTRNDGTSTHVTASHYAIAAPSPAPAPEARRDVRIWIAASDPKVQLQKPMRYDTRFAEGSLSRRPIYPDVDTRQMQPTRGTGALALSENGNEGGWAALVVDLPLDGEWYLWGRFYYPGLDLRNEALNGTRFPNAPNCFFVRVDGGAEKFFGNRKTGDWHWDGGAPEERPDAPVKLSLGRLAKGPHLLLIRTREGIETSTLRLSPRLDVLCLTNEPDYLPRDEDVDLRRR